MLLMVVCLVICILLILASSILIIIFQPRKQENELIRLSETAFTAFMGGMLIFLGFFILYAKITDPTVAGSDLVSYIFVGGFALFSAAGGCGIMFYTFVKKIIAYQDKVLYISTFGRHKELYWKDITEIRLSIMSNRITLIGKDTEFAAGGEPKAYKKFIEIAKTKISKDVGRDVLEDVSNRFII